MKIKKAKPSSSTSVKVTWGPISFGNSSTKRYTVCYQLNSPVTCSKSNSETVSGNTLTISIKGLNEFTKYYIAAFASSDSGDGPLGNEKLVTTCQDSKCINGFYFRYSWCINTVLKLLRFSSEPAIGPTITSAFLRTTILQLEITWEKLSLDESNGLITKYEVCYQPRPAIANCSTSRQISGVENTRANLTGLKLGTTYTVAIRAFTVVGPGPLGVSKRATTVEGGE